MLDIQVESRYNHVSMKPEGPNMKILKVILVNLIGSIIVFSAFCVMMIGVFF